VRAEFDEENNFRHGSYRRESRPRTSSASQQVESVLYQSALESAACPARPDV